MALAFLFGVVFGWVVWGARPGRGEGADGERKAIEDHKEIVVIKAELEAARGLLDQKDDDDAKVSDELAALDETVNRVNGRLKMILAAVKRAAGRE